MWALDFPFDETRRSAPHQAAQRRRRVHPRGPRHRRRPPHRLRRCRRRRGAPRRLTGRAGRICAWTTAPNSPRPHCGTGAGSGAPTPPTSSPDRPGRPPSWSPSTDACETSASTSRTSPTSPKPKAVLEDWRHEDNHYRPHQSLGGLTPAAYASHWKQHQHTSPGLTNGSPSRPSRFITIR